MLNTSESPIKQERRKKINNIARELFNKQGIAGTSMKEIAEQANIGRRTLYEYYSTKDEVILALRNEALDVLHTIDTTVDKAHNGLKQATYLLLKVYDHWIMNLDKLLFTIEFNIYYKKDPDILDMGMPKEYELYKVFSKSIEKGISDKSIQLKEDSLEDTIMHIISVLYGVTMRFAVRKQYKYGNKFYTPEKGKSTLLFVMNSIAYQG